MFSVLLKQLSALITGCTAIEWLSGRDFGGFLTVITAVGSIVTLEFDVLGVVSLSQTL